ncbi:MAG: hypothetical protein EPN97_01900 [Alphaproteobacteria bacterium]|nr:MAG: hypothetical protein EPN97_01900 [Alphaproteobacteria bacterium]
MIWSELPEWVRYLICGLFLFSLMSMSAVILSRAGKSPYWALFTVVPHLAVIAVWFFAFTKWPKVDA